MTYTINGKQYSEFDINKRCAELMGKVTTDKTGKSAYKDSPNGYLIINGKECYPFDPVNNIQYTWSIIEKCWDELMYSEPYRGNAITQWGFLMKKHNCTKLVAACIFFIEMAGE